MAQRFEDRDEEAEACGRDEEEAAEEEKEEAPWVRVAAHWRPGTEIDGRRRLVVARRCEARRS